MSYKKYAIKRWKARGLISTDYDLIYTRYINSTNCEKCGHDYSYYRKHMDHCHSTGTFRNILCHACNVNDRNTNTSGYPNITYESKRKKWAYQKIIRGKKHNKRFQTKNEAIIYKWLYEAGYSVQT